MSLQVSLKEGAERLDCMVADLKYCPVLGILHVAAVYCWQGTATAETSFGSVVVGLPLRNHTALVEGEVVGHAAGDMPVA